MPNKNKLDLYTFGFFLRVVLVNIIKLARNLSKVEVVAFKNILSRITR